jgi:hypothetical protein
VTAVNTASADTPSHTAPGSSATNGNAGRATASPPSARSATGTVTATVAPARTQTNPAQPPPGNPIRSSATNTSSAPGGWPAT